MAFRPFALILALLLLLGCAGDTGPTPAEVARVLSAPLPQWSPAAAPLDPACPAASAPSAEGERELLAQAVAARADLFAPVPPPAVSAPELPAFEVPASGPAVTAWPLAGWVRCGEEGVPGVVVHLVGGEGETASAVSGPDGGYGFAGVLPGDYLLLPQFGGQAVEPAELPVAVRGPVSGADFSVPFFVWHVDASAPAFTCDGMSWATALRHPQDAVDRARPGDAVVVANGVYGPLPAALAGDRSVPVLRMKDGIPVYGGFAGYETGGAESRNRRASRSELNGSELVDHVVLGASRARLDGFTITGGRSLDLASGGGSGGGMVNSGVEGLTVASCAFIDNDALGPGGAVHNLASRDLLFTHCLFSGNVASWGGAVANGACIDPVRFVNCTFARNAGTEGAGVALVDDAVSSAFVNCIVWENYPYDGLPIVRTGENPLVDLSFTCIDSALYPGVGNTLQDPLFAHPDNRDFRLLPGSPCIDAGAAGGVAGSVDAAKTPVPLDGDGDGSALPDLGALEFDPAAL